MIDKTARVYVAEGGEAVGTRLVNTLRYKGVTNLLNNYECQPDITDQDSLDRFFAQHRPEYVFVTAGKTGGIQANQMYPADLMLDNLRVVCGVLAAAHKYQVKRLLYLASSCSYPRMAKQPMHPKDLMTGALEITNSAYATAKLAGIELCRAYNQQYGLQYFSAITANVYGPGDDFSEEYSHVIAALIRRFDRARIDKIGEVEIWGSGKAQREFIFVDDVSDAAVLLMEKLERINPINIGVGNAVSIRELVEVIRSVTGYRGRLRFNASRPDGMPIKSLDSRELSEMGWMPKVNLEQGIARTYEWYKKQFSV